MFVAKNAFATMAKSPFPQTAEAALLAQLTDIDRRINDLQSERLALQRLLARVRGQNVASEDVTRKNSISRLVVEKAILDKLNGSRKGISTADIFRHTRSIVFNLNENTLRSYLHRLKARGLIVSGLKRGTWFTPMNRIDQDW